MTMKGKDAHMRRLRALSSEAVKVAGKVVFVGADMVRSEAFSGVSAGSVSGKNHVASSAGEYPNRDTGGLQTGFKTEQTGFKTEQTGFKTEQTGPLTAEFRSETEYSAPLEFGTSKMQARPHVRPARDATAPKIQALFTSEIDKLVKRSGK